MKEKTMDPNSKKTTNAETPIVDGDARPDMNVEGELDEGQDNVLDEHQRHITSERMRDENTLEDYKDEKTEPES